MSDTGWISIHRKIADNWLWKEKPFSYGQAWIDILIECNHGERKALIKKRLLTAKRGQSLNSLSTWANRWGWSVRSVRTFLKTLKSDMMIDTEGASVTTRLTVLNYDTYQSKRQADDKQTVPQTTSRRQADDKQTTTNNNGNNVNNGNKKKRKRFTPPLFVDVVKRMTDTSLKNHLDQSRAEREADAFINFYSSNGWKVGKNKMASWPSAVSTWLGRIEREEIKDVGYIPQVED